MTGSSTANFRRMLRSVDRGERLVPALRAYLFDPRFPSFEVQMRAFEERPPDGWFHPSTHPNWPERLLYHYLKDPEQLVSEPIDPNGTLAITAGHFWHSFVTRCLIDMGLLQEVTPFQCGKCGAPPLKHEHHVCDPSVLSRGAMDGITVEDRAWPAEVFEFKTMDPRKLAKIITLADFIQRCPDYYAQSQEYLRLSGYAQERVLIMGLILPYDMREIVVPFDQSYALATKQKYARVIQAVADQQSPLPCCAPRTATAKACPARLVCPIGLLS